MTGEPRATGSPSAGATAADGAGGPVVILTYAHSGAARVQDLLSTVPGLVCTQGTGVMAVCGTAADAWRRVEGQPGGGLSRLAVTTIRGLITVQVSTLLAARGGKRWCELASPSPAATEAFLRVFPDTGFLCVHRASLDVIAEAVTAYPWGLRGHPASGYCGTYPANAAAAVAAFWADETQALLDFEAAHPGAAHRIRYEDAVGEEGTALVSLAASLGLSITRGPGPGPGPAADGAGQPAETATAPGAAVPLSMIPAPLRERIGKLHVALGYPALAE